MARPSLQETETQEETAAYVRSLTERVEAELQTLSLPDEPAELYEPVRYVLAGGGKRIRPALVLLGEKMTPQTATALFGSEHIAKSIQRSRQEELTRKPKKGNGK